MEKSDPFYDTIISATIYSVFFVGVLVALSPVFERLMLPTMFRYAQSQLYQGLTDNRVLDVTPTLQCLNLVSSPPYNPWITASFFNDGPHSAFIAINNPDELHELAEDETYDVNMAGGDRRIEFIFYKSNLGERATVRAIGKY